MSKIITQSDLAKEEMVTKLLSGMPSIEKKTYEEIMRFIDSFDSVGGNFSNGILSSADIGELSQRIDEILLKSGYVTHVETFIKDMSKVTINSSLILDNEGFTFKKLPLSDIEKKWKALTTETLLDSGIREDFKRPILKIVDDAISYGDSISSTRETLAEFVLSGGDKSGKLKSYLTQTARDSVNQLQGQQMQSVANAVGYEGITYGGGLLTDSRGQCTHWVNDLKGFIPKDKLEAEIALAYKNQSAKKVDGKHHWGGMMPNTTVDNFCVKRGGFGCLHHAVPKRGKGGTQKTQVAVKEEVIEPVKVKTKTANTAEDAIINQDKWIEGLSKSEADAMLQYTRGDDKVINSFLRDGKELKNGITHNKIDELSSIIESAPKFEGEVYRGMVMPENEFDELYKSLTKGNIFSDKGFMSTSFGKDAALSFTESATGEGKRVLFKIQSSNGVPIENLSKFADEREVLFNKNSIFEYIKREEKNEFGIDFSEITLREKT
jgi:hypothetical protein